MARIAASRIKRRRVLALAKKTMSRPTAPYREGAVIAWIREFCAEHPTLALRDLGHQNLELRRRGVRRSKSPLVLAAHMDHPGFRAIRSRRIAGRRHFDIDALFLGGVLPEFFPGAKARFFLDEAHSLRARVRTAKRDRASGGLRARLVAAEPVPRGAFGMWDLPAFERRGPTLYSRVADDLAGVAAILALFEEIDAIDRQKRVDVRAVFTRAEEVGFVGALSVIHSGRLPRGARVVAIEASKALANAPRGAGPIVRVGDRTSIFDDGLVRFVDTTARELESRSRFRYQRRLMDGGTCESTAYQQYGFRSAGLCLPLANYHNMSERGTIAAEGIDLDDLVGLVRLFEALIRRDGHCPRRGRADPLRARLDTIYRRSKRELERDPFA